MNANLFVRLPKSCHLYRFVRFATAAWERNLARMRLQIVPPPGQHQMRLAQLLIQQDQYPALPRTAGRLRHPNRNSRPGSHLQLGCNGVKILQRKGLLDLGCC
jgi:hypothetical protein